MSRFGTFGGVTALAVGNSASGAPTRFGVCSS